VTEEYIAGFLQAENTFLYQLVFDPTTRELQPLTPYLPDVTPEDVPYAGSYDREQVRLET
jgi:exonuclease-1